VVQRVEGAVHHGDLTTVLREILERENHS